MIGGVLGLALWMASPVTFTRDVAPVLYRHCAGCHRPGQVGPFSLLTYDDAKKRARQIAEITALGTMPPWKPVAGHGRFQNERRLSASEIAMIGEWVRRGAPEGDRSLLPAPPSFPEWPLGPPDLIVRMPDTYRVAAEGPDEYRCFVLPLRMPAGRYVRAIDYRAGEPAVVHHALFFSDATGAAERRDRETPEPGYTCFGAPGFLPVSGLGGWAPGSPPIEQPPGVAPYLRRDARLVLQLHFHPIGRAVDEQSTIALYFAKEKPARRLFDVPLGSRAIDIPAGDNSYRVEDSFTLPVDVDAVGIIPHAHYIGRRVLGWATLPSRKRQWLLRIDDWDFNQQEHYRYLQPVRLPAGTRLAMEWIYDNSTANPRNPNNPPKRVVWGPDSTDEMAGLHVQVIAVRAEDEAELAAELWGKLMRSVGGSFYRKPPE